MIAKTREFSQGPGTYWTDQAESRVTWLENKVRELEGRVDEATRVYEIGGDRVVEVNGYAYRWRGTPRLEVGDRVLLPENWVSRMKSGPGQSVGTVTRLGSTYSGGHSHISRRETPET